MTPERARLLGLQREAASLLQRAAKAAAPKADVQRALRDAGERLAALGAEPVTREPAPPGMSPLGADLRADLRRAARELEAASQPAADWRFDTGPTQALLERVRARLEGEVALGLSFQGSYRQTQAKEPAYGGHASAMGPAPLAERPARPLRPRTFAGPLDVEVRMPGGRRWRWQGLASDRLHLLELTDDRALQARQLRPAQGSRPGRNATAPAP